MLKQANHFKMLVRLLAISGLFGSVVFASDVNAIIEKADTLLSAGKPVEALELYSTCSGLDPDNGAALKGIKDAKNAIRQEMGDVSAARLTRMLKQLDAIDAGRVKKLSAEVGKLEEERDASVAKVGKLEEELAAVRADAKSSQLKLAQVQSDLKDAKESELEAKRQLARLASELQQINLDRQADQRAAEERIHSLTGKTGDDLASLKAQNKSLAAEKDNLLKQLNQSTALTGEVKTLKQKNAALVHENTRLSNALQSARNQVASVKATASNLATVQEELKKAKLENSRLSSELDRLRQDAGVKKTGVVPPVKTEPVTKPFEDPVTKPHPVTQTRGFRRSLKKIIRKTEKFSGDVSDVEALAGNLKQELTEFGSIDKRLQKMDVMQSWVELNLEAFKKSLQETEALASESSE